MLPKDIHDLILDMKYSMERHGRHLRLMMDLDTTIFFRQVNKWYENLAGLLSLLNSDHMGMVYGVT